MPNQSNEPLIKRAKDDPNPWDALDRADDQRIADWFGLVLAADGRLYQGQDRSEAPAKKRKPEPSHKP